MSHIGEYVSISATNAGAIIDALTAALNQARTMEDYYKGQVVQLSADNASQDAEIKRLQDHVAELRGHISALQPARTETPAHKFTVGDKVLYNGLVDTIKIHDGGDDTFLLENRNRWVEACDISPSPSVSPDAALPTV